MCQPDPPVLSWDQVVCQGGGIKKKLESDINKIESSIDHANKANNNIISKKI